MKKVVWGRPYVRSSVFVVSLDHHIRSLLASRTPTERLGSREPWMATVALQIAECGNVVPGFVFVARTVSRRRSGRPLRDDGRGARRQRRHRLSSADCPYCAELRAGSIERRRRLPGSASGSSFFAAGKGKKKKDAHISSTSLLRTKAVRGAVPPRRSKEGRAKGQGLTWVCQGHCIAVSSRVV